MARRKRRKYFASYPDKPFVRIAEFPGWEVILIKPNSESGMEWMEIRVLSLRPIEHKSVFRLAWSRVELRFARTKEAEILCTEERYLTLRRSLLDFLPTVDWDAELTKM